MIGILAIVLIVLQCVYYTLRIANEVRKLLL